MPPAYTSQQKSAISQFSQITGVDRTTAAKHLKASNWNIQVASNNWYGAPQNTASAGTQAALDSLFEKYRKFGKGSDVMDMTAAQQYFQDIGVNLEDISLLIISHIVQSAALGEISKEGFTKGWSEINVTSIAQQKSTIATYKANLGSPNNSTLLEKVYKHAFGLLMQNERQRSADKAMCIEFWKILFISPSLDWQTPNTNWRDEWINFIEEHGSLKTVSRDQWNHVLKFAKETLEDPTLEFHSEEQSWPSVIDEFAEFMKERIRVEDKADVEMTN